MIFSILASCNVNITYILAENLKTYL